MEDGELKSLLKVSATIVTSMSYAHFVSARLPPGRLRFLALFPIISIILFLPWSFSSIHLRLNSFFLLWLDIFKLLLLSAGLGPLSRPSLPLATFVAIASLPLNLRPQSKSPSTPSSRGITASKVFILAAAISLYRYHHIMHPSFLFALHLLNLFYAMNLALSFAGFAAGALLGLDLDPQFDAPYRATSLTEFWGRRWNLPVTAALRPAVYLPVRALWGPAAGVIASFLASGLMHELLFYCLSSAWPTGEVTAFFMLQGLCVVAEAKAREAGWRPPPPAVAVVLTLGFVVVTGFWLYYPPLLRSGVDRRVVEECAALMRFLESGSRALAGHVNTTVP